MEITSQPSNSKIQFRRFIIFCSQHSNGKFIFCSQYSNDKFIFCSQHSNGKFILLSHTNSTLTFNIQINTRHCPGRRPVSGEFPCGHWCSHVSNSSSVRPPSVTSGCNFSHPLPVIGVRWDFFSGFIRSMDATKKRGTPRFGQISGSKKCSNNIGKRGFSEIDMLARRILKVRLSRSTGEFYSQITGKGRLRPACSAGQSSNMQLGTLIRARGRGTPLSKKYQFRNRNQ